MNNVMRVAARRDRKSFWIRANRIAHRQSALLRSCALSVLISSQLTSRSFGQEIYDAPTKTDVAPNLDAPTGVTPTGATPNGATLPTNTVSDLGIGGVDLSGLSGLAAEVSIESPLILALCVAALAGLAIAGISGGAMLRSRSNSRKTINMLETRLRAAHRDAENAERVLHADDQLTLLIKHGPAGSIKGERLFGALSLGDAVLEESLATNASKLLSFEKWLEPDAAEEIAQGLALLASEGKAFVQAAYTLNGGMIEVIGRMAGKDPLLRFRTLSDHGLQVAQLTAQHRSLMRDVDLMRTLLEACEMPVWVRDDVGRLVWVNQAYAQAVDTQMPEDAVEQDLELLDSDARTGIIRAQQSDSIITGRMSATMAGQRRTLDVVDARASRGSAGIATDVTATVEAEKKLKRMLEFHARTLDQLATPVAVFGTDQRLQFYNSAYQVLWELDSSFLDGAPTESQILDNLRNRRLLQEQSDFASWRSGFLEHYKSMESIDDWWYLPDGRSIHVMTTPHPQGGITQIFENVTEELDLRSQLKRVSQVQGETLDHLSEGVAVFTSDGRMQLSNPAFVSIWDLDEDTVTQGNHINDIAKAVLADQERVDEAVSREWQTISSAITGLEDRRSLASGQIDQMGGKVIDYALVPLADGMTMLTVVDVTDSAQVKQALIDRNQALEAADMIKSTFIKHVSYALRAPLTNIIGFAQLLTEPKIGPLNEKQADYVDHIQSSSSALMAIINDVLDLATVEAGILELELSEVEVMETIKSVIEATQDRLQESGVTMKLQIPQDIGSFIGDAKRVRQVLFNILTNALRFSEAGCEVLLSSWRDDEQLVFQISDNGPGIPDGYLDKAFKPFESTAPQDEGQRSVGLGLSIVEKFMELHNGTVDIVSGKDSGTVVTCSFPIRPISVPQAAE